MGQFIIKDSNGNQICSFDNAVDRDQTYQQMISEGKKVFTEDKKYIKS